MTAFRSDVRKVIFSADDFGLHSSINEAVEKAHNQGVLTSASLAVNGDCFDDALHIAKRNKKLGIGIHLVLNGEGPVSHPQKIFSILDSDGKLVENHRTMLLDILKGKVCLDHVALECEAQIRKFLDSGLIPTHLDSHRHLHLFPPIFKVLDPILKRYGIIKVRSLNIPWFERRQPDVLRLGFAFFAGFSRLSDKGYKSPDYLLGFFRSGKMQAAYLKNLLLRLKPGVSEISFHPGTDNKKLYEKYHIWKKLYAWKCEWEEEYGLLMSCEIKQLVNAGGISLINYSGI